MLLLARAWPLLLHCPSMPAPRLSAAARPTGPAALSTFLRRPTTLGEWTLTIFRFGCFAACVAVAATSQLACRAVREPPCSCTVQQHSSASPCHRCSRGGNTTPGRHMARASWPTCCSLTSWSAACRWPPTAQVGQLPHACLERQLFVRCGSVLLMYNLACRLLLAACCTDRQAAAGQRRAHAARPVGRHRRLSYCWCTPKVGHLLG